MKPGNYLMHVTPPSSRPYTLPVRIELWQGELSVFTPSGWHYLLCTFGPEYRFEPA
ncbi:MAG: hypothetical protein J0M24_19830 [Verrucomicrobia bacterium]|nr:hypothetical protein [Verrucomicrobiota bacterium]